MSKSNPASSAEPTAESNGSCGTDAAMCCANFYEQDIVQELMGGSFHPGGEELSTQLVGSLGMSAGSSVLDVACGVHIISADGTPVSFCEYNALNRPTGNL